MKTTQHDQTTPSREALAELSSEELNLVARIQEESEESLRVEESVSLPALFALFSLF